MSGSDLYSQKWNCTLSLFTKQNYNVLSPNFHIHVSVSDLYTVFPGSVCLFWCSQIGRLILEIYKSLRDMNVGIMNKAACFLIFGNTKSDFRYSKHKKCHQHIMIRKCKKYNYFLYWFRKGFQFWKIPSISTVPRGPLGGGGGLMEGPWKRGPDGGP